MQDSGVANESVAQFQIQNYVPELTSLPKVMVHPLFLKVEKMGQLHSESMCGFKKIL